MIPEGENIYTHSDEGYDDMPAHLKNSLLGCSLTIPIINSSLALGIWQGIYICEHRDYARSRNILITIW
jgi:secondary thiamine-phosphate synthase enzyme